MWWLTLRVRLCGQSRGSTRVTRHNYSQQCVCDSDQCGGVHPGLRRVRGQTGGRVCSLRFVWEEPGQWPVPVGLFANFKFQHPPKHPFQDSAREDGDRHRAGTPPAPHSTEKTSERRGPGGRDRQRQPTSLVRRVVPARAGVGGAGRDSLWRSRGCACGVVACRLSGSCVSLKFVGLVRGWGSKNGLGTVKAIICTHSIRMHTSYVLTLPPTHRHRIGPVQALHVLPHCRAPYSVAHSSSPRDRTAHALHALPADALPPQQVQ